MDKESIYLLQKLDCNCNDCGFMIRDFEGYKISEALALKINPDVAKSGIINHGFCGRFDKHVTFFPGLLQIETQECFLHRKDYTNETRNR